MSRSMYVYAVCSSSLFSYFLHFGFVQMNFCQEKKYKWKTFGWNTRILYIRIYHRKHEHLFKYMLKKKTTICWCCCCGVSAYCVLFSSSSFTSFPLTNEKPCSCTILMFYFFGWQFLFFVNSIPSFQHTYIRVHSTNNSW